VTCGIWIPEPLGQVTHGNLSVRIRIGFFGRTIPAGRIWIDPWVNSWCSLLNVHALDLSSAFLHLESHQPAKTIFKREIITLDASDDETENTSLVQKQICLLNLRHVARRHGFNLQEMHPDAFPNIRCNTQPTGQARTGASPNDVAPTPSQICSPNSPF